MKAGAVDFLAKPFDDQELLDAVREAVTRSDRPPSSASLRRQIAGS
jgi:FixJ family two-component response regulator